MRFLLATLLALAACSEAARILAFVPLPAKSHHYVYRPVIAALGKRGHQMVYYTGYPYEGSPPSGVVQVDLSPYFPKLESLVNLKELSEETVFNGVMNFYKTGLIMAPYIVGNPLVQKLIHSNERFDAVLFESHLIQEYQSAFIHKFGCVGIELLPLGDASWVDELAGLPINPAYQLDFKAGLSDNMDFWQRLYNTYVTAVTTLSGYYHMRQMQTVMDLYLNYTGWESRPPIGKLLSNRSLILTNTHFIIKYPQPIVSNRIEIGGVNVQPNKPLPKEIQKFMDESTNGVIYFSLGSIVNVSDPFNKGIHEAFIKVFKEIPQRVLMKWEKEYAGELPKNIKIEKWFPQQDVLAHKNCVLFITHGGYQSLVEAIHFGVPLVGMPFLGDQAKNLHFVEDYGIGKMLRVPDVSYETASKAVKEVLSNSSYKAEVVRRSQILRDRLINPADKAVYWIEHSIKYPNAMTPKAASLSFVQLHLIDVKLFIFTVVVVFIVLLWKLINALAGLFSKKQTSEPKTKNKKVKKH